MELRIGSVPFLVLGLVAAAWVVPALGTEVYTWTDESGVMHFSDSPPASGEMKTIEVDEVYRPGTVGATAPSADADAPEPATNGREPPQTAAQQKREEMARRRAELEKAEAENERLCALHRQRLEQMEPARRVFYIDEQGESVRMDDDRRVGLIEESKSFLAANCD